MLSGASSLLCGCHSPVGSSVYPLVVGVETLRSVSDVWCEIGGIGALPLREEPLSVPLPELSTVKCAPWCHLKPIVKAHKVYCWWHALGPTSTLGMQAVVPGVPQALCLQSHQRKSTSADPLKSGTTTAVVAHLDPPWELWKQRRPCPSLHVRAPTEPTDAKARPIRAAGAPVVHSDVVQSLSFYKASGRGINLQITQLWGDGLDFSPAS